jgi:hypothetical protein
MKIHEFFSEGRKSFEMSIGMAVFDGNIVPLVVTFLVKALEEWCGGVDAERSFSATRKKHADKRDWTSLRERSNGSCPKGSSGQYNKIPSVHLAIPSNGQPTATAPRNVMDRAALRVAAQLRTLKSIAGVRVRCATPQNEVCDVRLGQKQTSH